MNKFARCIFNLVLAVLVAGCDLAEAQPLPYAEEMMERLSDIQLNVTDPAEAEEALGMLRQQAVGYRDANPELAEAWIASARIGAVYALRQGMGGLALAKDVKAELETAIALDPSAQQGMAQGYLGQVYAVVPGWPLGFGDDKKGGRLMKETLDAHPDNALINLLYAQRLIAEKQYSDAQRYLDKGRDLVAADLSHPKFQQLQQRNIAGFQKTLSEKLPP